MTISGLQFRTINAVPVLATAHQYFGADRQPRAYIGELALQLLIPM